MGGDNHAIAEFLTDVVEDSGGHSGLTLVQIFQNGELVSVDATVGFRNDGDLGQ